MFVAYILTKGRFLRIKIIGDKTESVFKKGSYEYNIDPECMYQKKFAFLKLFFWSMYVEGFPNPLKFNVKGGTVTSQGDVPLDEIALIVQKVVRGVLDKIHFVISGITLLIVIWLLLQLKNSGVI